MNRQVRCPFQERNNLRTGYGWEARQKLVDPVASLKVIEERLDWHARACEHRRAPIMSVDEVMTGCDMDLGYAQPGIVSKRAANAPHERRGHSRLDLALYRTRVRSMRLLGSAACGSAGVSDEASEGQDQNACETDDPGAQPHPPFDGGPSLPNRE